MTTRPAALLAALLLAGCAAPAATVPAATDGGLQLTAVKQIPVGKTPHGIWAAAGFVYNSDVGDKRLSVIDTATDTVVKTIPFEGTPGYVKAFHDGKAVLVTDTVKGTLLVIDPAKDHQILQTIAVGKAPDKIRVTADDTVLVTLTGEPTAVLLKFDADRSKAPTRTTYAIGAASGDHRDGALDAGWIVAANPADNTSSFVELATGAVSTQTGGNSPGPVGLGVTDGVAVAGIVGNAASNTVTLFALPGFAQTTLSGAGLTPTDMAVDASLGRAFITMAGSDTLGVVDYVGKAVVGQVKTGKRPVHVYMPTGTAHEVWIGNDAGASVTVVDGESLRVKATVATDQGHHKLAFWGNKAYVSNITTNNVSVIDRTAIR